MPEFADSLEHRLAALSAPAPDPAFRLRTRNRMLSLAAQRRQARRPAGRMLRALLPRPALRVAGVALVAGGVLATSLTAAAVDSLPGAPLYAVKIATERVELAVTLDPAARVRLELGFAELRLSEAQRLLAQGRLAEALALIQEYDRTLAHFGQTVSAASLDLKDREGLIRYLDDRRQRADAQLQTLAGALDASGHGDAAAQIAHAQARADQSMAGGRQALQSHGAPAPARTPDSHPTGGGRP